MGETPLAEITILCLLPSVSDSAVVFSSLEISWRMLKLRGSGWHVNTIFAVELVEELLASTEVLCFVAGGSLSTDNP